MRGKISFVWQLVRAGCDPNQMLVMLNLHRALGDCRSVLDVGSGVSPVLKMTGVEHAVGAEGYLPSLEKAKKLQTHHEYVQCDVRDISKHFTSGQYDACIAMDVIEHLTKADGLKLIADMERIARKRVVFFTPCGFLTQGNTEKGDLQVHLSGWDPEEMKKLGYRVIGLLGPKKLRGEYHRLKRRPDFFWGLISLAGQLFWSKRHPKDAAAILCVKEMLVP